MNTTITKVSADEFTRECDALLRVVNVDWCACANTNERERCREVATRRFTELKDLVPKRKTASLCDLKLRALAAYVSRFGEQH